MVRFVVHFTSFPRFTYIIDLFSLYVLFSHFRPRDATRGNSLFQMSSYARANVRITNEKNKRKIPMRASRGLKWENKMYKLKRSIYFIDFNLDYNYLQDFSPLHILILGLNCNSRKWCLMFWCMTSTRMERESNIFCTFDKPHS